MAEMESQPAAIGSAPVHGGTRSTAPIAAQIANEMQRYGIEQAPKLAPLKYIAEPSWLGARPGRHSDSLRRDGRAIQVSLMQSVCCSTGPFLAIMGGKSHR